MRDVYNRVPRLSATTGQRILGSLSSAATVAREGQGNGFVNGSALKDGILVPDKLRKVKPALGFLRSPEWYIKRKEGAQGIA